MKQEKKYEEMVGAGNHRTGAVADLVGVLLGDDVQADYGIDLGIVQAALLDHDARAAFFAHRRRFLRRLDNELYRSADFLAQARPDFSDAPQHRPTRALAAGVHTPRPAAVPSCTARWHTGALHSAPVLP